MIPVVLSPGSLLRRTLAADAVASAGMAALLLAAADPLAERLSLSPALLRGSGAVLVPFALLLAWMLRRRQVPRVLVWAVVALNLLWAIDSIGLLVAGWIAPNAAGTAFVVVQAVAVAAFAELEWLGLRRTRRPATATHSHA